MNDKTIDAAKAASETAASTEAASEAKDK